MKNKFEVQVSQKQGMTASLEFENKKLRNEVDHLSVELQEIERMKNSQLTEFRSQTQLELQTLRRQAASSQENY